MLGQSFARIVDECLYRLDRGENLPDVLADFPAYQERLKPLLLVAMASRAVNVPLPNETSKRSGRNHMLAEMDQMASRDYLHKYVGYSRLQSWYSQLINTLRAKTLIKPVPSYRLAAAALVVAFGVGLFAVSASASPLPGGILEAFSNDFRQALGIFDFDQDGQEKYRPPALIFSGDDLYLGGRGAAKVAFLLDLLEDQDKSSQGYANQNQNQNQNQGSTGGSQAQTDNGNEFAWEFGGEEIPPQQENAPGEPDPDQQENSAAAYAPGQQDGPATTYAPGQQDGPATTYAPGQQDGPATDYAPGLVKKLDVNEEEKDKDKDEKDKDKDEKDKDK
jgi:hypothetical protein